MKRFLPLLFFILLTHSLSSQTADSSSFRPRVGIALSGGGAKGAAHIGVLKYLEEIGIPIDRVAGTSMGSIIGGLYALGYTPDELAVLIANMDWPLYMSNNVERTYQSSLWRERKSTYLFSVPFGTGNFEEKSYSLLSTLPSGVINGASLSNLFSRLSIGYNDSTVFDRLPIPFVCVATDILNGDSVLLRSGNFAKAIRSSMAIPGVFSPVEWNGHLLADGGLVNNFPVDQCLAIGADIVIGVEVADELARTPEQMRSLPQQLSQYLSIAVNGNRSQNRELCDIYLHPNISGYNMLSFSHRSIDTLVQRGYDCAKAHHDELMALKQRLEQFGPCHKQLQAPRAKCLTPNDTFLLSSIVYRGITPDEERWFNQRDGLTLGTPVTIDDIERAVGIFIGTGAYTNVTYNLTKTGEDYWLTHHVYTDALGFDSYNLTVNLQQTEPHLLSLGFRYDSEESASLLLHLGWNEQRLTGFKAGLDLDLTYNVRFAAKASYDGLSLGDINLAYNYHNSSFSLLNYDSITSAGWRVNHHIISLFLSEFLMRDVSFAFGINEEFFSNHTAFSLNNMLNSGIFHFDYAKGFLGLFVKGRYDNLDNAYFATRGLYLDADATWRNDNKKLFVTPDSSFFDIGIDLQRFFSPSSRLTLIPQFSTRLLLGNASGWFDNMVGGALPGRYLDQQMAFVGFTSPLHVAPLAAILRFDARYRIGSRYYFYIMANEVLSTTSFLHIDTDLYTTLGLALRLAYDSPIGPVAVDLQWNDFTHRVGAYLNIGFAF